MSKPDVKGILFDNDSDVLYDAACRCPGSIIEIGSFRGGSTILLGQGLKDGYGGFIYTIDPYNNRMMEDVPMGIGFIVRNLKRISKFIRDRKIIRYNLSEYIVPINKPSYEADNMFKDGTFSLLFIDGDHTYPGIKTDLMLYIPKLESGGVLIVHDRHYPGIKRAISEEVTPDKFSHIDYDTGTMACVAVKK
jgi:predicted O-methyltransferase YrrM